MLIDRNGCACTALSTAWPTLNSIYTEQECLRLITIEVSDEPVICIDQLEPNVDDFTEAAMALARLDQVGGSRATGFATFGRTKLQRE